MSWFSSNKTGVAQTDPAHPNSTSGSGAEQDRYASHFSAPTQSTVDSIKQSAKDTYQDVKQSAKDTAHDAATYAGAGAEQARYATHWSLDAGEFRVKDAAKAILKKQGAGAEQERFGLHFGMGSDGWQRAKSIVAQGAQAQGVGAEQDRYAAHFGLEQSVIETIKEALGRR